MKNKTLLSIIIDFLNYVLFRKRKKDIRNKKKVQELNNQLKFDYKKIDEKFQNITEPEDVKRISDRLNKRFNL